MQGTQHREDILRRNVPTQSSSPATFSVTLCLYRAVHLVLPQYSTPRLWMLSLVSVSPWLADFRNLVERADTESEGSST